MAPNLSLNKRKSFTERNAEDVLFELAGSVG
jgi:hypothetical protein